MALCSIYIVRLQLLCITSNVLDENFNLGGSFAARVRVAVGSSGFSPCLSARRCLHVSVLWLVGYRIPLTLLRGLHRPIANSQNHAMKSAKCRAWPSTAQVTAPLATNEAASAMHPRQCPRRHAAGALCARAKPACGGQVLLRNIYASGACLPRRSCGRLSRDSGLNLALG